MKPDSLSFELQGRRIAALSWGDPKAPLVLALHGWLDNAASFYLLAPQLKAFRVLAIDLAGHGHSDWIRDPLAYQMHHYLHDLDALIEQLGVDQVNLLGHSLGAGVASLYAGVKPERIAKLGLIENIGPLADRESDWASSFRKSLQKTEYKVQVKPFDAWVRARMKSLFSVPEDGAIHLMRRNTDQQSEGYSLRIDPKLREASVRLTEPQIRSALQSIEAPTLLISATLGVNRPLTQERLKCVSNIRPVIIEGGHHLHLEEKALPEVAATLNRFYA